MRLIGGRCTHRKVFSQAVLTRRGLTEALVSSFGIFLLLVPFQFSILGVTSEVDTPDPISNSEVKHSNADDTAGQTVGKVGRCPEYCTETK